MLYSEREGWGICVIHHIVQNRDNTFSVMAHINVEWCDYCDEAAEGTVRAIRGTSFSTSGPHQHRDNPYSGEASENDAEDRAWAWAKEQNKVTAEMAQRLKNELDQIVVSYDPHRALIQTSRAVSTLINMIEARDHDLIRIIWSAHEDHSGPIEECEQRICRMFRSLMATRTR